MSPTPLTVCNGWRLEFLTKKPYPTTRAQFIYDKKNVNKSILKPSLDLALVPTTPRIEKQKFHLIEMYIFSRGKILQRMREHDMRLSRTLNQNWTFRCYQQPPFWGSLVDIHITFFCILGIYIEPVFLVLRVWLLLVSEWRVTK